MKNMEEIIREINNMRSSGYTIWEIAQKLNVSEAFIVSVIYVH